MEKVWEGFLQELRGEVQIALLWTQVSLCCKLAEAYSLENIINSKRSHVLKDL